MSVFCFHGPILLKETVFLCCLCFRNGLSGTGSGLMAANEICMAASPTDNSAEDSRSSSVLIPLGRSDYPLLHVFPFTSLTLASRFSCFGCFDFVCPIFFSETPSVALSSIRPASLLWQFDKSPGPPSMILQVIPKPLRLKYTYVSK